MAECSTDLYGGFARRDQEIKYNSTLFDLIATLSARVTATLKLSKGLGFALIVSFFLEKPSEYKKNLTEMKVGLHV